jgi:hypothetical protein
LTSLSEIRVQSLTLREFQKCHTEELLQNEKKNLKLRGTEQFLVMFQNASKSKFMTVNAQMHLDVV